MREVNVYAAEKIRTKREHVGEREENATKHEKGKKVVTLYGKYSQNLVHSASSIVNVFFFAIISSLFFSILMSNTKVTWNPFIKEDPQGRNTVAILSELTICSTSAG